MNQYTSESIEQKFLRFWNQVAITSDDNQCWLWTGSQSKLGYGRFTMNGHRQAASCIAWQYPDYNIPAEMEICHSCDNPSCCNPKHLFLGTHNDNMQDMIKKGRANHTRSPKGEKHGCAKLNEFQVIEIRQRYAEGGITQKQLGIEYGVDHTNIWLIVHNKKWKHLTP